MSVQFSVKDLIFTFWLPCRALYSPFPENERVYPWSLQFGPRQ